MAAPTYFQLEEALETAALQVETMGAIIAYLALTREPVTIKTDDLRHIHDTLDVIVTPNGKESITISLKEKNDK